MLYRIRDVLEFLQMAKLVSLSASRGLIWLIPLQQDLIKTSWELPGTINCNNELYIIRSRWLCGKAVTCPQMTLHIFLTTDISQ